MSDVPWVGLAALIAMFVIPFLPSWLFGARGRSSTGRVGTCVATVVQRGARATSAASKRPTRLLPSRASFGGCGPGANSSAVRVHRSPRDRDQRGDRSGARPWIVPVLRERRWLGAVDLPVTPNTLRRGW